MRFDADIRKTLGTFRLNARLQSDASRLAVIGASGSGKSLLLQMLAGLADPDGGHIRFNGETWFDGRSLCKPQARNVGLVFQNHALFPHLTVAQNIAFGLQTGWRNPKKQAQHNEKVAEWLDIMQLATHAGHYPYQISGGQQQRTALARALITEPRLLLLDEPFSALDTALRRTMRQELDRLQRQTGVPFILVSHDPADAEILADEVWETANGVLCKTG
ncbi:ABC transporter ATP-binding protein [Neisseria sp.]|uniref:ABC transporter ATP-binding protein n=1 Tax=Neisseria sp. TaxID=192066 RepID=UPI0035A0EBA6